MNFCMLASSPCHATPTKSTLPAHRFVASSTEGASLLQMLQPGAQNQTANGWPAYAAKSNSPPPINGALICSSGGTTTGATLTTGAGVGVVSPTAAAVVGAVAASVAGAGDAVAAGAGGLVACGSAALPVEELVEPPHAAAPTPRMTARSAVRENRCITAPYRLGPEPLRPYPENP